jgi:hypothetical protein
VEKEPWNNQIPWLAFRYIFVLKVNFIASLTGLYSTSIMTKFPAQWIKSKGSPAIHQVTAALIPAANPPVLAPITK